ncbi:MAG: hypothetical protein COY40_03710 [Alphaproteobacteria bacterium CG_4_10_14_0_8_um_filter_53_9]|nr:MAG: hypothetical protein COY40_03710 [Alphaproteobacteria bacterium CG_4_10_14_0_8_um_filter_53_9]
MSKTILITGAAGFIGMSLARQLLDAGHTIIGLDNMNDYYDTNLKHARLKVLEKEGGNNFTFYKADFADREALLAITRKHTPGLIVHLGAQAGVRYGLLNQDAYLQSNLIGHFNILMAAKELHEQKHLTQLLYASSSSVYGHISKEGSCAEDADTSKPVSLYAATKVADEALSHAWQTQFGISCTGLRFFTVYGPWGRPDMTPLMFTEKIMNGDKIPLFNSGDLWRDFTYIDDIVKGITGLIARGPQPTPEVFNLGNQNPVQMTDFVQTLASVLGKEAFIDNQPWPPTEVYRTSANTEKLKAAIGWAPATPLAEGLKNMATWYQTYKTGTPA